MDHSLAIKTWAKQVVAQCLTVVVHSGAPGAKCDDCGCLETCMSIAGVSVGSQSQSLHCYRKTHLTGGQLILMSKLLNGRVYFVER